MTGFDAGPQFVFNFGGGPGVRVHQFGGARPRARPRNPGQEEETSMFSTIMGLLPVLLLFIFPLLSSIFSGSEPAGPNMTFDGPTKHFSVERTMPNYGYKYYVNKDEVSSYSNHKLSSLDKQAETKLVQELNTRCLDEQAHQQRLAEAARGWFGPDPEKMAVAQSYHMPNCIRLKSLIGR